MSEPKTCDDCNHFYDWHPSGNSTTVTEVPMVCWICLTEKERAK